MKTFRIVVGVLAIIPFVMLVDSIFLHPDNYGPGTLGALVYLVFGIPMFIFNMWAWVHPEIIEFYFLGEETGSK